MVLGWLYAAQRYSIARRKLGVFVGIPMAILFFVSSGFIILIQEVFCFFGI